MNRIIIFALIITLAFSIDISAQNVKAYLNYNEFYSPEAGSYLESYVSIEGNSMQWKKQENGKMISQAEVTIIFRQDSQIIDFSKNIISSQQISDSSEMNQNFMHISRFILDTGKYNVSIKLDDINDTLKAFFTTTSIHVKSKSDSIFFSSIEVFKSKTKDESNSDPLSKSGYSLVPNIYNYLSISDTLLNFYAEIYNTEIVLGQEMPYLLKYSILNAESRVPLPKYSKFKRMISKPIQPVISNFNIKSLPSNNYILRLEIRDKKNNIRAEKEYYFQKQNHVIPIDINDISNVRIEKTFAETITGIDTLADIIKSLGPISNTQEASFAEKLIKDNDQYVMQQYLYSFWEKRAPMDPFKGFKDYMSEVRLVEQIYGGRIHKGYATDRGYIYLKYGKPNSIAKDYNDPAAYPYEIWHYYQTKNQSNVRFVFYNTDLASKDFRLLHSTAIGEVSDYQWRLRLRKRDSGFDSIDDTGNQIDDWGSNVNRYYENPR
jgi:GWxTD domain-containing protein